MDKESNPLWADGPFKLVPSPKFTRENVREAQYLHFELHWTAQ
jgi:hypothetical protein